MFPNSMSRRHGWLSLNKPFQNTMRQTLATESLMLGIHSLPFQICLHLHLVRLPADSTVPVNSVRDECESIRAAASVSSGRPDE